MKQKSKFRRFFTLSRKHDGFTLVELIVVIAIMAILAGVGTVGYSGYIKSANKKADMVLVGNVMRAIETGTNSTMFVNSESMKVGATTYPVGVIVLTADGCGVKESTSTVNKTTTECNMVNGTFYKVISTTSNYQAQSRTGAFGFYGSWGSASTKTQSYYKLEPVSATYCSNHTSLPTAKTYKVAGTAHNSDSFIYNEILGAYQERVYSGIYYELVNSSSVINIADCTGMFSLQDESTGHGTSITQESLEALPSGGRIADSTTGNPLYDSITAAFGTDHSSLKLQYDGWGDAADSGHTYATILSYGDGMISNIKDTAEMLTESWLAPLAKDWLSDDYENSADMVDSYANFVSDNFDEGAWANKWETAANAGIDYDYGISQSEHKDFVYATAKSYNSAFASYCEANNIPTKYASVIENFSTGTSNGIIKQNVIPRTVNNAAFATEGDAYNNIKSVYNTSLYDQFVAAGEEGEYYFGLCKDLYSTYINNSGDSSVSNANSSAIYDTMGTLAQTGSTAYANGNSDDYFAYYDNYMKEMSAFYNILDEYQGEGIMIMVTVENGAVKCEVSPSAANPRND